MVFYVLSLFTIMTAVAASTPQGVVPLDDVTFDKIVHGGINVLVKFDTRFPFGSKQEAWKEFAKRNAGLSGLLLAEVQQEEDTELNNKVARRFKADNPKDWPLHLLFKKGSLKPIVFNGEVTADTLSHFVSHDAGVWIGLEGSLEGFVKMAHSFLGASPQERREMTITARNLIENYETELDRRKAKYYLKTMAKIMSIPDHAHKEYQRIKKVLKGSVMDSQRSWLENRMTILASFTFGGVDGANVGRWKDEL